jgi:polyketide biosynthesis enoyl-CoA hydratase PksI
MADAAGKNGLTQPFIDSFVDCLNEIKANEGVRAVLLTGLSDIFCSGADLDTLRKMCRNELKPIDIVLSRMILNLPVPVIAAMEGHAIGGGFAVGLCADMVVLAEESRYGCSFMNMGFTPGMGITKLIEHFVAPSLAHEMMYTGTFYKGKQFIGKSSFNYIVPRSEVREKAFYLAQTVAEKPRLSLAVLKSYLSLQRRKSFEETLTMESMMHDITLHQESMAAYIEANYVKY